MCDHRNPERGPMFQMGTYRKINEYVKEMSGRNVYAE
jgi:hypothetical protein